MRRYLFFVLLLCVLPLGVGCGPYTPKQKPLLRLGAEAEMSLSHFELTFEATPQHCQSIIERTSSEPRKALIAFTRVEVCGSPTFTQ